MYPSSQMNYRHEPWKQSFATSSQKHLEFIQLLITYSIKRCQLCARFPICPLGPTSVDLNLLRKMVRGTYHITDMYDICYMSMKTLEINQSIKGVR